MFTRHKLREPVKSYLLGQLDDDAATRLESRYFTDPAFFHWVQDEETCLIADYLKGALPPRERELFEARYLTVPELKRRLEEVRGSAPGVRRVFLRVRWQIVFATLVIGFCALSWLLWRGHGDGPPRMARNHFISAPAAVLAVHLVPGLAKGAAARQVEFAAPTGGRVRLSLELPGRRSTVECRVALAAVASDGSHQTVWTSPGMQSAAAGASQEATVELDSSVLRPGDYVGEVADVSGAVLETYAFRVAP
jgi:anti-sigma factor RsiW